MNGEQIITISAPRDVLESVRAALEFVASGAEPETKEQELDLIRLLIADSILEDALYVLPDPFDAEETFKELLSKAGYQ
jgi:hypothetical protein